MTTDNRSVSLTLEVISPLFLAGAEPRGAPELRPPSLRGALRYWLRALLGAASLQTAQTYENTLFGTASDKDASAGAVALRVTPIEPFPPPKGYAELTCNRPGAEYLWFAARATQKENERKAIPPGAKFALHLSAPRSANPQRDLFQALAVLKVATLLGGVGNRSRRFAGAIQAVSLSDGVPPQIAPVVRAASPRALAGELAQVIQVAQIVKTDWTPAAQPDFDVIHPSWCEIYVHSQTRRDALDVINEVGEALMNFRHKQPDAAVFARAALQGQPTTKDVQRPAFGLPIPFYYKNSGTRATLQAEPGFDRRASPIWMQVVRLANGDHTAVFTWFRSRFLPDDAQLVLKQGRHTIAYGPVPDEGTREAIIRNFFSQLDLIPVPLA